VRIGSTLFLLAAAALPACSAAGSAPEPREITFQVADAETRRTLASVRYESTSSMDMDTWVAFRIPRVRPRAATIDRDVDLPIDAPTPARNGPTAPAPVQNQPADASPPSLYGKDLLSENGTIVYAIDISSSMAWDSQPFTRPDGSAAVGCRLDRAKAELTRSIMSLPKTLEFDVLAFDCSVYLWRNDLTPADEANKQRATEWLNQLQPQGATGTGPAVAEALSIGQTKLVVLLTDGAPNCGAGDGKGSHECRMAHRAMISACNTNHAVIHVFGICATGDMRNFCMEVAADSGGSFTFVP
jgi:hypothetical protein